MVGPLSLATAINSLPQGLIPASFIETFTNIVKEMASQIRYLKAELASVKADQITLKQSQGESHEVLASNIASDRKRLTAIENKSLQASTTQRPGSKTESRVEKIDQVLKTRGPTTLKELCRILNILPQELSRLLRRLDKRRYELSPRPGDRRFKVLRIRAWSGSS